MARRFLVALLILVGTGARVGEANAVSLEMRYRLPGAESVYLVWGVDGWQVPADSLLPAGTRIEYDTARTPMIPDGDWHTCTVQIPAGTRLDYGFLTVRHVATDRGLWEDADPGDFRIVAREDTRFEWDSHLASVDASGGLLPARRIEYHFPGLDDVTLRWRVSGSHETHETPMTAGAGDLFVARVAQPAGTAIDFAFRLDALKGGRPTAVLDGDLDSDGYYTTTIDFGDPHEVTADLEVVDYIMSRYFVFGVGFWGLIVTVAVGLAAPWLGRHVLRLGPWFSAHVLASADAYGLPPRVIRGIAWAPVAIVAGSLAFLTFGLVRSPQHAVFVHESFRPGPWNYYVFDEYSIVQMLGFSLMLIAGIAGFRLVAHLFRSREPWAAFFFALFCTGIFVTGMEEINWGQLIFGYESNEFFRTHGRSGTASFHNIGDLDRHSADLLQAVFGVGGILGIALTTGGRWRSVSVPVILLPWFVIIAGQAGLYRMNDWVAGGKYYDWTLRQLVELIEMMIGMAGALYIWLTWRRVRRSRE